MRLGTIQDAFCTDETPPRLLAIVKTSTSLLVLDFTPREIAKAIGRNYLIDCAEKIVGLGVTTEEPR